MTHFFKQLCPLMMMTFLVLLAHVDSSVNDDSPSKQRKTIYQRSRRSDKDNTDPDYRFSEEYFRHPSSSSSTLSSAATSDDARISRAQDRSDEINDQSSKIKKGCERIVKNSMICMVCKEPKTNSKYEQCSYVATPRASPINYTNNHNNNNNDNNDDENAEYNDDDSSSSSRYTGNYNPTTTNYDDEENDESRELTDRAKKRNSNDSTRRHKDGAGQDYSRVGKEEKENDGNDGIYAYANSERYSKRHYPNERNSRYNDDIETENYRGKYNDDDEEEYENDDSPRIYRTKESRKSPKLSKKSTTTLPTTRRSAKSEENANGKNNNCKQIQKDSMTCTICEDPENGGNFERCSYAHQPNDKLYKFSKSRSFGYPSARGAARNNDDDDESSQSAEN